MDKTYVAYTTKGLEHITEKEIKSICYDATTTVLTKRIVFSTKSPPKNLLKFRTVDDIHLLIKDSTDTTKEDVEETINFISKIRNLNNNFSITLSRYKSDIDLKSLESQLSKKIEKLGLNYTPRDRTNLDFRVHAEDVNITLSCRLSKESLYKRKYRKCELKGALKPTIAAALCYLVSPRKGEKLVDNFCGTGTILCEGFLQGLDPYGGDINPEAVNCACENIKGLSSDLVKHIKYLDARCTNWPDSYFDYAISNLPWGKQVDLKGVVKLYSPSIAEYARILKKEGNIVLLGMKPDLIVKHLKKNFQNHKIEKFKIGFLGQTPWVVSAQYLQ